jgi:molybdenum cofactor cytidylyltransferase
LLAAGGASRFGADKLLAELPNGTPVAARAARNLVSVVADSRAVIRPTANDLARLLNAAGLRLVENSRAEEGIAGSIAAGVGSAAGADGWLIALADMPWIRQETIRAVVDALEKGAEVAAPTFNGSRGHPVGFSRRWRDRLLALSGDRGAGQLIAAAPRALTLIPTSDPGILRDIDRPSDLTGMRD